MTLSAMYGVGENLGGDALWAQEMDADGCSGSSEGK